MKKEKAKAKAKAKIKTLTKQQIFNKTAKHLIKQGRQAINESRSCLYRAPRDLKCAIGCLIPDRLYDPLMEGNSVNIILDKIQDYVELRKLLGASVNGRIEFLHNLQVVHDDSDNWKGKTKPERDKSIRKALLSFAADNNLKTTAIKPAA